MRYFKLKALSVSGLGKKVHKIEENAILSSTAFPKGRAVELVQHGFLFEVNQDGSPLSPVSKVAPTQQASEAAVDFSVSLGNSNVAEKKTFDEISAKELRKFLDDNEVSFHPNANKKDLYKKYEEVFEG